MRVLILLFALLGIAFAAPKTGNRIVGGLVTTVEQYPFMTNMQYHLQNIWWTHFCGGSLLNTQYVLSAADCFQGDLPSQWRVLLGTSFASEGGTTHAVSRIIIHENYNNPIMDNDIALIRLDRLAVYSNVIQPARIPASTTNLPDDISVTIVGWGTLSHDGARPEELRDAQVPIINQQVCAARYAALKLNPGYEDSPDVSPGMICTGNLDIGGKGICQGDAGGPNIYQDNIIVGITSWSYRCADPVYPGVSSRVSHYTDWIVRNAV